MTAEPDEIAQLCARLSELAPDDPRRQLARNALVERCMPMVRRVARRYRWRGEPYEDLVQVGLVGLIHAADRFDPSFGVAFTTFALPTVLGEIKRHFRDKSWMIRVPREMQERRIALSRATDTLTNRCGRAPTTGELAKELSLSESDIEHGLEATQARSVLSLDMPIADGGDEFCLADTLGSLDPEIEAVEYREALTPMLAKLPDRERTVLLLTYFGNQTQAQIGARMGVSQMQVSRLLNRTLDHLRTALLGEDAAGARHVPPRRRPRRRPAVAAAEA